MIKKLLVLLVLVMVYSCGDAGLDSVANNSYSNFPNDVNSDADNGNDSNMDLDNNSALNTCNSVLKWGGKKIERIEPIVRDGVYIYRVETPENLAWLAKQKYDDFTGSIVKFIANIDMNNKPFNGIEVFNGEMDGNNKKICNLKINKANKDDVGFIHLLRASGNIHDLNIVDGTISGKENVGALVGHITNDIAGTGVTIMNNKSSAMVIGKTKNIGGIVGLANVENTIIENNENTGRINGKKSHRVGGIVGFLASISHMRNNYNTGEISGENSVGGVIGYVDTNISIENLHNYSTKIRGGKDFGDFGALIGTMNFSNVLLTNSYFLEDETNNLNAIGNDEGISMVGVSALTEKEFKNKKNFDISWDFQTTWSLNKKNLYPILKMKQEILPKWDGVTAEIPKFYDGVYEISHPNHLAWVSQQTSNSFAEKTIAFTEDIDMNDKPFIPIRIFSGKMEGNGKKILHLNINSSYAGLIEKLSTNGRIENLSIVSGNIKAINYRAGAFAAYTQGTNIFIVNCVNGADVTGDYTGGIVGYNYNPLTIENSANYGNVTGSLGVGGMVGHSVSLLTIKNSVNYGDLKTVNNYAVGGMVGQSAYSLTIENSKNYGDVTAYYGGGMVGYSTNSLTIENSVNYGAITGNNSIGGIVGYNTGITTISKSSNQGDLVGNASAGGIIGYIGNITIIKNSYNKGSVFGAYVGGIIGQTVSRVTMQSTHNYTKAITQPTASANIGAIAGVISGAGVVNIERDGVYFIKKKGLNAVGAGNLSGPAVPITLQEFKSKNNFWFWDFDTTWELVNRKYPTLR